MPATQDSINTCWMLNEWENSSDSLSSLKTHPKSPKRKRECNLQREDNAIRFSFFFFCFEWKKKKGYHDHKFPYWKHYGPEKSSWEKSGLGNVIKVMQGAFKCLAMNAGPELPTQLLPNPPLLYPYSPASPKAIVPKPSLDPSTRT